MAFLSQATSSWRLASSSRLPFRSMLLTLRGGPESLAPRAHQIPVSLMVFSTFLCRAFTAHEAGIVRQAGTSAVASLLEGSLCGMIELMCHIPSASFFGLIHAEMLPRHGPLSVANLLLSLLHA